MAVVPEHRVTSRRQGHYSGLKGTELLSRNREQDHANRPRK
jgi:hypothetical protein